VARATALRIVLGAACWIAVGAGLWFLLLAPSGAARRPAERLARFAVSRARTVEILLPTGSDLRAGDPVFVDDPVDLLRPVGTVEAVFAAEGGAAARLAVWPEEAGLLREGAFARALTVPETAAWVVSTLLPAPQRDVLLMLARDRLRAEGANLRAILWPPVREGLVELIGLLEEEIPRALAARAPEWEGVLARYRDGVFRDELLPVLREVVLPVAREKFGPLLDEVGGELWAALPKWSLGARYLWESSGLGEEGLVRERFHEFLEKKAEPIVAAHGVEIARLSAEVVREAFREPRVREALSTSARAALADPELGALFAALVNDLVFTNDRLADLARRRWEGGLAVAASEAFARLEPLVREAVDSIVLDSSRTGINPRLVRVLRARVFRKDGRFVLLTPGTGATLPDGARLPAGEGQ
jgi:hypothetical protein